MKPKQKKPKLKPKQPVKTDKQQKSFVDKKKVILIKRNGFVLFVKYLGKWKDNQIDWIVCRIYTMCWHEDYLLGIL